MRRQVWWWALPGIASLAVALAILLWPLHENGVSGNALRPHYGGYGWFTYSNTLSTSGSEGQLVISNVDMPRDVVADRRHAAAGFGVLGILLVAVGVVSGRRARQAGPADPA